MKKSIIFILLFVSMIGLVSAVNINITLPANNSILNFGEAGQYQFINYSIFDSDGLNNCWWEYNNVNTSIDCDGKGIFSDEKSYDVGNYDGTDSSTLKWKGMKVIFTEDVNLTKMRLPETSTGNPITHGFRILNDTGDVIFSTSTAVDSSWNWSIGQVLEADRNYVLESQVDGGISIITNYGSTLPVSSEELTILNLTNEGSDTADDKLFSSRIISYSVEEQYLHLEDLPTLPNHILTIYGNDTLGNIGSNTTTWEYKGFVRNQSFSTPVLETASEDYIVNLVLGTNTSLSSAELFINSSSLGISTFETDGRNVTITKSTTVPTVTIGSNSEIFGVVWNLTFADTQTGSTFSNLTTEESQTVNELIFNLCGVGTALVPVLNFTMVDELTNNDINAVTNTTNFEATWNLGANSDSLTKNFSYSNLSSNSPEFNFCTNNESNVFFTDMQSDYSAIDYSDRNYYLNNATLDGNSTNEIDLFLLPDENSIQFFITVLDSLVPVEGVTIQISKFFVGDGLFKTVEIDLTDSSGRITSNLELDAQYRFNLIKDGEVLGIFEKNAICEQAPCEITLNLDTLPIDFMAGFNNAFASNVVYEITFNQTTKMVDFDFVDTTGLATSFRMDIIKTDNYINGSELIDTQRVFTSSGSMSYNASLLEDGSYRVDTYIARSPDSFIAFLEFIINSFGTSFGLLGFAFAFVFILVFVFGVSTSPSISIMAVPVALNFTIMLGILSINPVTLTLIYGVAILSVVLINK